jgi:hypothetical protein
MNDWYSKYKDQGLEIVAIHTPEFSFEKDIGNVEMGAKDFNLKFPIVLDNDYATWNAYQNRSWPHKFLINIDGDIVYDHIGEGAYDVTEAEIIKLLNERKTKMGESGKVEMGTSTVPEVPILTESPETYFGSLRNNFFGNGTANRNGESSYAMPTALEPNRFYLGGRWKIEAEFAESTGTSAQVSYTFTATNVYIVAQTADGSPETAQVLLDGKPIPEAWSGSDVSGNGTLTIKDSRLYHLYSNPELGRHRLDIIFQKPGVRVFTFTFG